jgi:hypothetical protein
MKGLTKKYTKEDISTATSEELHLIIEDIGAEQTKNWTDKDRELINGAMKNISDLSIWDAIYQARKWALLEARATTVKMESEEERQEYFDREIGAMDNFIKQIKKLR